VRREAERQLSEWDLDLWGALRQRDRCYPTGSAARWLRLGESALCSQTAALLHHHLDLDGPPEVPEVLRQRLRRAFLWNTIRNQGILAERDRICAHLTAAGLPVLVMKGAHLGPELYAGHLGVRAMSDVDVLVHVADLQAAQDTLLAEGYGPRAREPIADTVRRHRHLPGFRRPGGFPVEVHWTLSEGRGATWGPERLGVWERAVPLGSTGALAMEELDALLYTCRRLGVHDGFGGGSSVAGLVDVGRLLERGRFEPAELRRRTREWGIGRAVSLVLILAEVLLGAPVPADLARAVAPRGIPDDHLATAVRTLTHPNPLRTLLRGGRPTLVPPPPASGAAGPAPVRGLLTYVRRAAFPDPADLRLDQPGRASWLAWPTHWSRVARSHARLVRWVGRRDEFAAEAAQRAALRTWLAATPGHDPV
jgi:hypothetical protein